PRLGERSAELFREALGVLAGRWPRLLAVGAQQVDEGLAEPLLHLAQGDPRAGEQFRLPAGQELRLGEVGRVGLIDRPEAVVGQRAGQAALLAPVAGDHPPEGRLEEVAEAAPGGVAL